MRRKREVLTYREVDELFKFGNAHFSMEAARHFNRWVCTEKLNVRPVMIAEADRIRGRFLGYHSGSRIVLSSSWMEKMSNRDKWALVVHEIAHYRVGRETCNGRPHPPEFKTEMRRIHEWWWEWALHPTLWGGKPFKGLDRKRRAKRETCVT